MDMYLQLGYGMMGLCRELVGSWGRGCVILSPRDLNAGQLETLSSSIRGAGGKVVLDPQFYIPHADHARLVSHGYWPAEYESADFWSSPALTDFLTCLHELSGRLHCTRTILPGVVATAADESWFERQNRVQVEAERVGIAVARSYATVALSGDVVRTVNQVQDVLEEGRRWNVCGVYLVCEPPNGEYLVQDPIWLANVLELAAGFRLQGKRVVIGYCNHQMLAVACCSVRAIGSGTWLNVRSFTPTKFQVLDEEIKRKTTWYYCPQALSEYKLPTLDIAMVQGVLDEMAPPTALGSPYADILFEGVQPSTVAFGESQAFRHYLQCLYSQARAARRATFDETISAQEQMLDTTEELLDRLHAVGVRGQLRDFKECVEANRAALAVLRTQRGPMLRRRWAAL